MVIIGKKILNGYDIMAVIRTPHRIRLGNQLRELREEQGWTVAQVATMADLKEKTIEKIEDGVFNVPLDVLAKVADVLGADLVFRFKR